MKVSLLKPSQILSVRLTKDEGDKLSKDGYITAKINSARPFGAEYVAITVKKEGENE